MSHLLFITSTRIGDAVISTSALALAQARFPAARLTIACGPLAAPLFRAEPGLEELIVLDKSDRAYWLAAWARMRRRAYVAAIDLRGSLTSYFLRAEKRFVFRGGAETLAKAAQFAELLGAEAPAPPRLFTDRAAEDAAAAVAPGAGFLALGPGANFAGKRWPPERFAALARALTGTGGRLAGRPVVVLGAAEDHPIAAAVAAETGAVNAAGTLDLPAAAALLRRAGLFVGNDSGLMHIAAAVGAPTVGLFGPSNHLVYAPAGPRAVALRAAPTYDQSRERDAAYGQTLMEAIDVARVAAAAATLVEKDR